VKPKIITRAEVDKFPGAIWNAFVDVVCMSKYENLSPEQRPAHLVFWYDSEVCNGGHDQYFHNRRAQHLSESLAALIQLGAACQHDVLREAIDRFYGRPRERAGSLSEYVAQAQEQEYSDLDARLNACSPSLYQHMQNHLNEHQSTFVIIE
jgi:hypothetical protein